ncbi:MAG: biotin transporter BioY [Caulobacteraceae bacterium]
MKHRISVRDISYIALFATLTAVSGYISVPLPFPAAPVTAQTLSVMLAGGLLPAGQAALSILIFLLMGAVGLPAFSGGAGGLGIIVGKTGGYLIGFLIGAVVISLIRGKKPGFWRLLAANVIGGIIVVDICGALWLDFVTGMGISKALIFGVLPFIPGDMLKSIVAAVLSVRLYKHINITNSI